MSGSVVGHGPHSPRERGGMPAEEQSQGPTRGEILFAAGATLVSKEIRGGKCWYPEFAGAKCLLVLEGHSWQDREKRQHRGPALSPGAPASP